MSTQDPLLAEAAALLARAWSGQSAASRRSFAAQFTTPPQTPAGPDVATLDRIRERAALSGSVRPADLLSGIVDSATDADADPAHVLDVLALEFDRVCVRDHWQWTLRSRARRQALTRLVDTGRLVGALADAVQVQTDEPGRRLREIVAELPDVGPAATDIGVEVQALTWAAPLGGLAHLLAEARRQAGLSALAAGYRVLSDRGVFGRDEQRDTLRRFVEQSPATDRIPMLSVVGIGGAGKSTLLASFIEPYLARNARLDPAVPAVVVIDFDRVLFRPNAELEMSFELTRQLGRCAPIAGADFSALRHQTRSEHREIGLDRVVRSSVLEADHRGSSSFERQARLLVELHGLADRRVVLVLDTFEEWQRDRGAGVSDPEDYIADWITRWRFDVGLQDLRVIISGRARIADAGPVLVQQVVELGGLDRTAAVQLLVANGVSDDEAALLFTVVGGNPLTLRVAARFLAKLDTRQRQEFLDAGGTAPRGLTEELRRAVLYDRFLGHIAEEVRPLAHPGLALRRITPELVRFVLAGPCGLGTVDGATARDLTERLANEVWLVKRTPDGLRHQPDVRRAMVEMMATDPERAARMAEIHRAAVDWYAPDGRHGLTAEDADVERLYHQLMLLGDEDVVADRRAEPRWLRAARAIGTGVSDFRPGIAAQVRVLLGDDISAEQAKALPIPLWYRWVTERGERLVDAEDNAAAVALLAGARGELPDEPRWLAEACCGSARWADYWREFQVTRATPGADLDELRSGRFALLNALCSDVPAHLEQYREHLHAYLARDPRFDTPAGVERVLLALLVTDGVPADAAPQRHRRYGVGNPPPSALADPQRSDPQPLFPVDQFRLVLYRLAIGQREGIELHSLPSVFRPDPEWISAFADLVDPVARRAVRQYLHDLEEARAGATPLLSDQVLGEWAARFARAAGGRIVLPPRFPADRLPLLRGDNPELRAVVRFALAAVGERPDGMAQLCSIAEQVLPIPTADLTPAAQGSVTGKSMRKALLRLVEYVDVSGVLPDFVRRSAQNWPEVELVGRVDTAVGRWDRANRRLLDRIGEALRR